MLKIASSQLWLQTTLMILDMQQYLVQAVFFTMPPVCQLPYLGRPDVVKHLVTKKRNISTIKELMSLKEEDRKSLLRSLEESELSEIEKVATQYPTLKVKRAEFSVLGETVIVPNSIVTATVSLKLLKDGEEDQEETKPVAEEPDGKKPWWKQEKAIHPVHAPFYPNHRVGSYYVILGDVRQNRLITMSRLTFDKEGSVRILFFLLVRPKCNSRLLLTRANGNSSCLLRVILIMEMTLGKK
jgi:translocation protein SEC63